MNLIIVSRTKYNKYSRDNKINDYPIVINYTINYFNHYYPFNVYIHRDINDFISPLFNFFDTPFLPYNRLPLIVAAALFCFSAK